MNSLEFINQKIEKIIFKLIEKVEEREKFAGQYAWTTVDFLNAEIKKLENDRDTLFQIKSELEAWYVMNEEFIIKPYYQQGKYPAIMVLHPIEDDEVVRRGVKQEKYDKVLKALEVKENVD